MATWRGIDYLWNTPSGDESGYVGSFANDATRVESNIHLRNPYNVAAAVLAFTGFPALQGSTGARFVRRTTPHFLSNFLDYQASPWLYCVSVSRVEGKSFIEDVILPGSQPPLYRYPFMRLVHTSLTYEILEDADPKLIYVPDPVQPPGENPEPTPLGANPDEATLNRYVTRWKKPFNRMVSIPRALPKFVLEAGDDAPKKADKTNATTGPVAFESIGKPEPGEVLHYTWHLVPREGVPADRHRRACGRVNAYTFDGYPPGTLLCETPEVVPIKSANGQWLADVHYTFRFIGKIGLDGNYKGWNHLLRSIPRSSDLSRPILDYRRVTTDGNNPSANPVLAQDTRIFKTTNFADLFRPV